MIYPLIMLGTWEIVAIVAVVLLLFGGRKIPQQIGMQATHLSAIINGARNITPALADKIAGGLTEIPSSIWVHLQEQYNYTLSAPLP